MADINFIFNINLVQGSDTKDKDGKWFALPDNSKANRMTIQSFGMSLLGMMSVSTEKNYLTALRSLQTYNKGSEVLLSSITPDYLMGYERWLRSRDVCPNTASCYMRSLRSIFNKAVRKGLVCQNTPFDNIYTGNDRTEKRAITLRDINRIKMLSLKKGSYSELCRDVFLFSFYALGMPFVDIAHLKKSQIKDNVMTYYRSKTGRKVRVKIEPCMRAIIEKYAQSGQMYVFPILCRKGNSKGGLTKYERKLSYYNKILKILGRMAGIKGNVTSYTSRHTWASVAYSHNVDLPVISKALGHASTKTTLIYISEINDSRLDKANRKILKELYDDE